MPSKTTTHDDPIEIAAGLRNFVVWMAETIQAEGPIPTKIFVAVGGIEHPDHAEEFRYNRASALKMRRLLLQKARSFGGMAIIRARQAGGLSEHGKLIDDIVSEWADYPSEDHRHSMVFLDVCRHVLPLYDPAFELRAMRTKSLADAYHRALRLLASLIQPAEAPPTASEPKEVAWSDDAAFMASKDATEQSKGKLSLSALSKLLTPTGPIRHMRHGQRCKVHVGDFMVYLRTMAGGLSDNEISDVADELFNAIERRRVAEWEKQASGK